MSLEVIHRIATLPRLFVGAGSSILGAITGAAESAQGIHWLQITAWGFSALAGLATSLLAFARFYDWARKTFGKKPTNTQTPDAE